MPKAHSKRAPSHQTQPSAPVSGDTEMSGGLSGGEEPEKAAHEPAVVTFSEPERKPAKPLEAAMPPPTRRDTRDATPKRPRRRVDENDVD